MAAATNTTVLLGSIILLAARSSTLCCLGFAPASRDLFTNHQRQHSKKLAIVRNRRRIRPSASDSNSALFGLANVNDYFASFNTNSDDDNDDDPNDGDDVDASKTGKYIGHGRIDGGGNEGGLFDTNNYFSSFANDSNDGNEDYSDESQSTDYALTDESSDEPSSQQFTNKQPMQRMTYEEIVAYNNARLCPKMLLTQRAIQSFIYLLEECRDPHSGKWLEDYLGLQNLGNYHGTGAIDITQYPTWDNVLYSIMSQPNEKMIVSAKRRGRGHGGWSKNNPYLPERWVEFKIDIRPASLVQRLLPLRQQLAKEFLSDLDIVGMVDEMIMDSYFDKLRSQMQSSSSNNDAPAFDRISVDILTNHTEFQESGSSSSPFRRGNFDLLYSLCTQASAHQLLRELQQSSAVTPEHEVAYEWFKQFYIRHVPEYFDGDQKFGRADDFIDALLRTPPSLVELSDGKHIGLTDPLQVAERIIGIRSEIANEWKGLMDEVSNDHVEMNNVLFRVMMGRTIDESGNDVIEIEEERTLENLDDAAGAFE